MEHYTMNELNTSMTVYYYRRTGVIHFVDSGVTTMQNSYPTNWEDMSVIENCIVFPYNQDVMDNKHKYKIDLDSLQLIKVVDSEADIEIKSLKAQLTDTQLALTDLFEMFIGG